MKRSLSALLLTLATLTATQFAAADDNPACERYKLVDQNHAAMQHYGDQAAPSRRRCVAEPLRLS